MGEMRNIWTEWNWQRDPEAPRAWELPERTVALLDADLFGDDAGAGGTANKAAFRTMATITVYALDALFVIPTAYPDRVATWAARRRESFGAGWPANVVPALRVERQADLSPESLRALVRVKAPHRALVVSPREEIDLRDAIMGYVDDDVTGGRHVRLPHRTPRIVQEKELDLVVVRGPIGPEAWPIHPAWVRSLKDQCQEAGVAFALLSWGAWKPVSEAVPGDERAATATANVWRFREGDPDDLPLLAFRVGAERSGRTLDDVEHLNLPEGL